VPVSFGGRPRCWARCRSPRHARLRRLGDNSAFELCQRPHDMKDKRTRRRRRIDAAGEPCVRPCV
jgi:hypothetical protein